MNTHEILEDLSHSFDQEVVPYNPETVGYKKARNIYNLADELMGTHYSQEHILLKRYKLTVNDFPLSAGVIVRI